MEQAAVFSLLERKLQADAGKGNAKAIKARGLQSTSVRSNLRIPADARFACLRKPVRKHLAADRKSPRSDPAGKGGYSSRMPFWILFGAFGLKV
jgi:hypothetical protein